MVFRLRSYPEVLQLRACAGGTHVSFFAERPGEADTELSAEQVAYYRQVLLTHGSVFGASNCSICGIARCPDWVDAYDKLAAAGQVMAEPERG